MTLRTVEDRLREEYFVLLPEIRAVMEELEAEVRHCLLPLTTDRRAYEQITVTSRVKECESALQSLRRRQESRFFDAERAESYSLTALADLPGVRVLAFPPSRMTEANGLLRKRFPDWTPNHVLDNRTGDTLAFKYYGNCKTSKNVKGEYQVTPMLTGLFWQVEHGAMYKLSPELKGAAGSLEMEECRSAVYEALKAFEETFERQLRRDELRST